MEKFIHTLKLFSVAFVLLLLSVVNPAYSQVGINTTDPDPSSLLDLRSTERGFLVPRLNAGQRQSLVTRFTNPANSLMVFDTDHKLFYFFDEDEPSGEPGAWKALNPWYQRGSYGATNSNAVYFLGNVGIGTDDPVSRLEVNGTATAVNVTATGRVNTNTVRAIDNSGLQLFDNGNNGIFVEDGGRVGINFDDPDDRLDVGGNIDVTGAYEIDNVRVLMEDEENNLMVGTNVANALVLADCSSNVLVGNGAGTSMTQGSSNVFIGKDAAGNCTNGLLGNVMIGVNAGADAGSDNHIQHNVYIGPSAGRDCVGNSNVFIGDASGRNKKSGNGNIFLGQFAGSGIYQSYSGAGDDNILIGDQAGQDLGDGSNNIFIGAGAGLMAEGDGNIVLGMRAGFISEGNNIVIGNESEAYGTNKLVIGHGSGSPLISGDMSVPELTINGDLNVTGACNGCASDSTLKTNIRPINYSSLEKIIQLKGYTFDWKENTPQFEKQQGLQIGLMAQEVKEQFPLLVGTSNQGYLYVEYQKLVVPLIESVKELKSELDAKDQEIAILKKQLSEIKKNENEVQELKERMARLEQILLNSSVDTINVNASQK